MNNCPNPNCNETRHESTAIYCHRCGWRLKELPPDNIDERVLAIIKENSYSKRVLAAYEARRYANRICRKQFGKTKRNYKEYVEMLMAINYPKELEKSILGKNYLIWLCLSVAFSLVLIGVPLVFLKTIPLYKKLKSMCI